MYNLTNNNSYYNYGVASHTSEIMKTILSAVCSSRRTNSIQCY